MISAAFSHRLRRRRLVSQPRLDHRQPNRASIVAVAVAVAVTGVGSSTAVTASAVWLRWKLQRTILEDVVGGCIGVDDGGGGVVVVGERVVAEEIFKLWLVMGVD